MAKKYNIPNDEPQMASESVVAHSYESVQETIVLNEWDESDAPCQFSPEELHTVILHSLDDKKNGNVHSHADVQAIINSRIEAWM